MRRLHRATASDYGTEGIGGPNGRYRAILGHRSSGPFTESRGRVTTTRRPISAPIARGRISRRDWARLPILIPAAVGKGRAAVMATGSVKAMTAESSARVVITAAGGSGRREQPIPATDGRGIEGRHQAKICGLGRAAVSDGGGHPIAASLSAAIAD